jgi:hypothetical protein
MCKDLAEVVMNCVAQRVPKDAYEPFEEDMVFFANIDDWSNPRFQLQRIRLRPVSLCNRACCAWHKPWELLDRTRNERMYKLVTTTSPEISFCLNAANGTRRLLCYWDNWDHSGDCKSHPVHRWRAEFNSDCCRHPVWYGPRSALFGVNGSHALHRYLCRLFNLMEPVRNLRG